MATKTPPTVSSFLWGYEAPALMLNVLRDARDLGFAKGFKARFKRNLEKHGETHGARSNCRITWYHDGRLISDVKIESIPGDDDKVENYLEKRP